MSSFADASLNKRPKRHTKIALITAGVAIIAIAAGIGGVALYTETRSKTAGPSSSQTSTPPPRVAAAALDGLLLSPDQIDTVMGATGMTVIENQTAMDDDGPHVSDKACLRVYAAADSTVYAGSGWTAERALRLAGGPNYPNYRVFQSVVLFRSAHDATTFLTGATPQWFACANRQYTYSDDDDSDVWTVGPVANNNGTLSATETVVTTTLTYMAGWTCQRALTVAIDVAVDIIACNSSRLDAAINIAHQIAAKVPTM